MYHIIAIIIPLLIAWDGAGHAVVSWTQPSEERTCLYKYSAGAEWPAAICWDGLREGESVTVSLPGSLMHPAYRVQPNDRLELRVNNVVVATASVEETQRYFVYLPAVQKEAAPRFETRLAWVGR